MSHETTGAEAQAHTLTGEELVDLYKDIITTDLALAEFEKKEKESLRATAALMVNLETGEPAWDWVNDRDDLPQDKLAEVGLEVVHAERAARIVDSRTEQRDKQKRMLDERLTQNFGRLVTVRELTPGGHAIGMRKQSFDGITGPIHYMPEVTACVGRPNFAFFFDSRVLGMRLFRPRHFGRRAKAVYDVTVVDPANAEPLVSIVLH
jgi:hypothetical protein